VLFFLGCETVPENPEKWIEREQNACLPTAIVFRESLKKYQIWSEVVAYSFYDYQKKKKSGHAIVAYLYPPGTNQLWTYDYLGSWKTRAWTNDPKMISQQAEKLRGNFDREIIWAEFLK
jgi:hypothetical protein